MTPLSHEITKNGPPLASNDAMTQMTRKWKTLYRNPIYRHFTKVVSLVSLCHGRVPWGGKRLFSHLSMDFQKVPKLTPHKGMCHAHTSGHRYDLIPLKSKGRSYCCFAANDIRAFQLALGIAAGVRRISCGRSSHNMKGRAASPTSCSKISLTEHGRKLCLRLN
jgi:hypothetical protein